MKIIFFDTKEYEKEYLEKKLDNSYEKIFLTYSLNGNVEIEDNIKDAEVISCFIDSNLSKKALEKFPNLKFIVLRSVGFSHVDLAYCKEKNIHIFNAPHYGDSSIAEYVFAILLTLIRKVIVAANDVKKQEIEDSKYLGLELFNKTIGIVGLGAIGKRVAEIAKAFSMNVIYYDIQEDERFKKVTFDELLNLSDVISINCNLNDKTLHMFNSNSFKKMKKGVIIVNTARGEVIQTTALFEALISKKVSFAALDVMECEEIIYEHGENKIDINCTKDNCLKNFYVASKLLNMENVIITPHIAYNTKEAKQRILEISVENIFALTNFTNSAKNLVLI